MLSINTNINNLKLQRHLNSVSAKTQLAVERMSTGYRINNASDDAAGLVISKALKVQENGLTVANDNAQMATNILNVADGALSKMTDLTLRIRDLALQASNGGYSQTERTALQMEASQLTQNMEQLIQGTTFNEYKIFGEQRQTIKVGTAKELLEALNSAEALNNVNYSIALTSDIDLNDLIGEEINGTTLTADNNWVAIGDSSNAFKGTFDGNGFTIKNLKINNYPHIGGGLFGYIHNATIKDVKLENVVVQADGAVGSLAAYANNSSIINCSASGEVRGVSYYGVGGLVGICSGLAITNCSFDGSVLAELCSYVGGLIGLGSSDKITNCSSFGVVNGGSCTGGLIGYDNYAIIANSYTTSDIMRDGGATNIGGFIGSGSSAKITNCYSLGQLQGIGNTTDVGGFIGNPSSATLSNCNYIEQTYSYEGSGTKQTADWFKNTTNWEAINTGSTDPALNGYWDLSSITTSGVPKLNKIDKESLIIKVSTAEELFKALNSAEALNNASFKIELMNNIDLNDLIGQTINGVALTTENNWVAIGTSDSNKFCGVFDGNNYTISNLTINKEGVNYQGLFGVANGNIINVNLENANVKGGDSTGALVGNGRGLINNCSASGVVSGGQIVGGLVGDGYLISDSFFSGSISGVNRVGGLVGQIDGGYHNAINACYSTGEVVGENAVGGLVGFLRDSYACNSYTSSNVVGVSADSSYLGGFIGILNYTNIKNCYSYGQIQSVGLSDCGGFVGGNSGSLTNCNYVAQTNGYEGEGTKQNTEWFDDVNNIKTALGNSSAYDYESFNNGKVKLEMEKLFNKILNFQIGTDGTDLSAIEVDTSFKFGDFFVNLTDVEYARMAIDKCDQILAELNKKRAQIGASSNIMQSITQGNSITKENLSASNSRITDADIARESANMVKNQILQNTASALLSQSQAMDGGLLLRLLGV